MTDSSKRRLDSWVQIALLIVAIVGGLLHLESRLSKVEQAIADGAEERTLILQRLEGIEKRLNQLPY